jgi:DNA-3-methyladenine glycosylase II
VTAPGAILDAGAFDRVAAALVDADDALARVVAEHGVPPFWSRPAGFRALVLLILEQQVSLASAEAAYRRLRERVRTVTPETVLACSPEALRADGVSRQKDRYLRALSEAVLTGALDLDALATHDDDTARAELIALPGIGRWTADVYLLACLGRPDLWPVGDRALQVAVAETLELPEVPDPVALEGLGERWRPHRSSAARILWHGYLGRRGRVETPHDLLDDLPAERS